MAPKGAAMKKPDVPTVQRLARAIGLRLGAIQLVANLTGVVIVVVYFMVLEPASLAEGRSGSMTVTIWLTAGLVALGVGYAVVWERPLMQALAILGGGQALGGGLLPVARRKALNAPLALGGVSMFNWLVAAVVMSVHTYFYGVPAGPGDTQIFMAARVLAGTLLAGVVAGTMVFFATEAAFRRVRPLIFPAGDLAGTPGALRVPLRGRLLFTMVMVSLVPMVLTGYTVYQKAAFSAHSDPGAMLASLGWLLLFFLAAGVVMVLVLTRLLAGSVTGPVGQMARAMERVGEGDLSVRVPVASNDELGLLAESFNQMIEGLAERDRIKDTFGRFVSPAIARTILEDPPPPEGEATTVSVLFADIRNYTTICEHLAPAEVIAMLNSYFSYMVEAVEGAGGLVYQFVGDGIMAVFGAPARQPDHCERALLAALAMQRALVEFNAAHRAGLDPLRIGVGVASGPVVAGLLGSEARVEYRVVGDTVNLASRVEGLNKDLGTELLIDEATRRGLKGDHPLRPMGAHHVKGREQAVTVYAPGREG